MALDIEIKVDNSHLRKSGYTINQVEGIRIQYDKYNPTRASKYIEVPKWIASKRHVLVLRTTTIIVSTTVSNPGFLRE